MTSLLSMPRLSGVRHDIGVDLDFGFFEGGLFDGARLKIIIYVDHALFEVFHAKERPQPESLRWFPLLQKFEFEVCDKG